MLSRWLLVAEEDFQVLQVPHPQNRAADPPAGPRAAPRRLEGENSDEV